MCSAECTLCPNTAKYNALADITLLRFDMRAFAHTYVYMICCARYGHPGDRE